ncbi:MAG TPA: hypothetical protein VE684_12085 [Crenalkalicoccus sp.]|nr:hypothetical protein [Crenalkalicoccus sp.]
MSLCLVLHDFAGDGAAEKACFDAVYEIAPEHWRVTPGATLVATGVSPRYLRDHLLGALRAQGLAARMLFAARIEPDAAAHGLTAEGEAWLAEVLGE